MCYLILGILDFHLLAVDQFLISEVLIEYLFLLLLKLLKFLVRPNFIDTDVGDEFL